MQKALLFIFLLGFSVIYGKESKPTICLNMIVKDESKIIDRCLDSVINIIDYWVILDTGSKDGTQKIIKEKLKNIPGKLYERPWVNFEHNRNEALKLAKKSADYILFIDADEVLMCNPEFTMPKLDKDWYLFITQEGVSNRNYKPQLIRAALNWEWKGVVREELFSNQAVTQGILSGLFTQHYADGSHARDQKKYKKNIALLEEALIKEPENSSYVFQLASNYKLDGNLEKALENYTKRSLLEGNTQERYCSLLEIGKVLEMKNATQDQIVNSYSKAFHYLQKRAEPLYFLANYFLRNGNPLLCYILASYAKNIPLPLPEDNFQLEHWIYDYGLSLLCLDGAFLTGKYSEALDLTHQLLSQKNIPSDVKNKLEKNRQLICNNLINEKTNSPDVLLLTMKKSGTHLITKYLRLLLARNDQEYEYVKTTSNEHRAKHIIESPSGYKIQFAHLPYEKFAPLYKQFYNKKKILLIRDPRDVLISGAHFIPNIFQLSKENYPPGWAVDYVTIAGPFLKKFSQLSLSSRLKCLISQEVPSSLLPFTPEYYRMDTSQFIPPFDFSLQIPAAVDYMNSPNTLVIYFEDLVGPKGGGTLDSQHKCLEKIAHFIGLPLTDSLFNKISNDLYGSTFTFREGKSNSWKEYFTEENKDLFKNFYGEDLIKMGYEKNMNW